MKTNIKEKEIQKIEVEISHGRFEITTSVVNGNVKTIYIREPEANSFMGGNSVWLSGGINDLKDVKKLIEEALKQLEKIL